MFGSSKHPCIYRTVETNLAVCCDDYFTQEGRTALLLALGRDFRDNAKILLDAGADGNASDNVSPNYHYCSAVLGR